MASTAVDDDRLLNWVMELSGETTDEAPGADRWDPLDPTGRAAN